MDESHIIEQLRTGADGIGTDDSDVDALVAGAVVQGRRRRTRRRAGTALGAVVVAAVVVTVVATGVVPTRLGTAEPAPVATPVVATPVPSRTTPAPTPRPSDDPTAPGTTGVVRAEPSDVATVATGLLPDSLTVTRSSAQKDAGSNGFPWEYSAALTVRDDGGTSYLFVSLGNGSYGDGCLNLHPCRRTVRPDGGIVWTTSSPGGDKAGLDRNVTYDRADGGHLSLMVRNYGDGDGPVTRSGLPLTDAQARDLVTSTAWDRLFQG